MLLKIATLANFVTFLFRLVGNESRACDSFQSVYELCKLKSLEDLKSLEEDGWICKTGYYESTGGRKAQSIEIVKNARTAIGVFILKHKFLLRAVNLYGEVIKKSEVKIDFDSK